MLRVLCDYDHEDLGTNKKRLLKTTTMTKVMHDTSDAAAILFQYYFENSFKKKYMFPDEDVIRDLGWTQDKVKRLKSLLRKAGWIHTVRFSNRGEQFYGTYLGKQPVSEAKGENSANDDVKGVFDKLNGTV